ncbi:acylneuraminate cytidylyltransferase family protein [Rhodococcus sp. 06-1460-1B]|uniref:acylneuraminate cytidylyltransferase family protein n=1 Tax=Rhodococcus sp. 06-1460-1B TaxID=2022501 RepID=UPI000B9C6C00|nr:acylneuraminate cytidylyltransferase family protein [Rhodococcus sp. 06-1460-1B]OZD63135.1 acylneuraminate cytidylyltransferase [Rhodococcus sp. 06-1460-1B]
MTKVTAIVPMRHNSERVPGKNYRDIGGVPLFHHIVKTLLSTPQIGTVVVDTDSDTIVDQCRREFPSVELVERPQHLRDGGTPMNDVLLHTVSQVSSDLYLQTHSTNPFLSSDTIGRAIVDFESAGQEYDSLFGVTKFQGRFWTSSGRPLNHDPSVLARTQDLEPMFLDNSCLYIFSAQSLRENNNRIGRRPMMFSISGIETIDIDNEEDFVHAAEIAQNRRAQ